MLDAAGQALVMLLDPFRFGLMCLGVAMGLVIGILPGLAGMVGLALLLPFIYGMDVHAALAMMMGLAAITCTSDTIPAVLFGVPGTTSSVATILDGYPMAKKGEAGRAFGAAFIASMIGGLFGALILTLSLPIARPIVLACGSPEFFMLCMLGIGMVAVLTGRRPMQGAMAAAVGLLLAAIGPGPTQGYMRYTFDLIYLFGGIPLVVMALGLFALPEVADLLIRGTTISEVPRLGKGFIEGAKDVFRHWAITLRCSALGAYIGFIPGLGGSVANWLAYGHVVQTSRDRESFGTGDVRGVIAPEAANNAKEGGALIPTIVFGIPGSGHMVLILAAFLILGINPGPEMLTTRLDLTFTLIWSLAIANVLATGACFLLSRPLAQLTTVRVQYWAPFILMLVILGAFQSTRHWGDLIALLGLGLFGWLMKRQAWPRPPLLVGFVLGKYAERYLYRSIASYGAEWVTFPGVIGIGVFIIVSLVMGLRWQRQKPVGAQAPQEVEE